MDSVVTTAAAGFLCGSFLGAAGSSKTEYVSFVDKNKASQFTSHHHAKVLAFHISAVHCITFPSLTARITAESNASDDVRRIQNWLEASTLYRII